MNVNEDYLKISRLYVAAALERTLKFSQDVENLVDEHPDDDPIALILTTIDQYLTDLKRIRSQKECQQFLDQHHTLKALLTMTVLNCQRLLVYIQAFNQSVVENIPQDYDENDAMIAADSALACINEFALDLIPADVYTLGMFFISDAAMHVDDVTLNQIRQGLEPLLRENEDYLPDQPIDPDKLIKHFQTAAVKEEK